MENRILTELINGPSPAPKRITPSGENGEVRITKPADPEKLAALRKKRKTVRSRRRNAGLEETNTGYYGERIIS